MVHAISAIPGARRLLAISVLARMPLTMLSIGLLLDARHLTGSFAAAGGVDAAYAISLGLGAPLLGRAIDRRGQTAVLPISSLLSAGALGVVVVLPVGTPLPALIVAACVIGATLPPVDACLSTLIPSLTSDPDGARAFYTLDATVVELTWVTGPALAVTLASTCSPGVALAAGATLLLAGTLAFAAQPASRDWRPAIPVLSADSRPGRSSGLITLIVVMGALGLLYSAVQVGVAAATSELGAAAAAGPLLALWGVGSLLGGVLATRRGGGARSARGISLVLLALAVGHLPLTVMATSTLGMGVVLLLAGTTIAPTEASVYAMVAQVSVASRRTEAFSWLATSSAVGAAAGAAAGGGLAASAGPAAAFALAGAAGLAAVLACALRADTLPGGELDPAALGGEEHGVRPIRHSELAVEVV